MPRAKMTKRHWIERVYISIEKWHFNSCQNKKPIKFGTDKELRLLWTLPIRQISVDRP